MKKILNCAAMAAMVLLAWSADGATPVKKAPAKKSGTRQAAEKPGGTSASKTGKAGSGTKSTTRNASAKGRKAPVKSVTWRNRQTAPSADRYREIQGALAAKGFLSPEEATGSWTPASAEAMKRFQAEQNLETSGKINSLSLIALGLGPRRETAALTPPKVDPPAPGPGQ